VVVVGFVVVVVIVLVVMGNGSRGRGGGSGGGSGDGGGSGNNNTQLYKAPFYIHTVNVLLKHATSTTAVCVSETV